MAAPGGGGGGLHAVGDALLVADGPPPPGAVALDGPPRAHRHLCLMDADLFRRRADEAGIDPARIPRVEVPFGPGALSVGFEPPGRNGADGVRAVLAASPVPARALPAPDAGGGLQGGQAHALLSRLAAVHGSPYAALADAFLGGAGRFVWAGGRLRVAPRPADPPEAAPEEPSRGAPAPFSVRVWDGVAPPAVGTAAHAATPLAVRMGWCLPPVSGADRGPAIGRMPFAVHSHWLSAALLFLSIDPPEWPGEPPDAARARATGLAALRARMALRASRHPDRDGLEAAMEGWRALGAGAWLS